MLSGRDSHGRCLRRTTTQTQLNPRGRGLKMRTSLSNSLCTDMQVAIAEKKFPLQILKHLKFHCYNSLWFVASLNKMFDNYNFFSHYLKDNRFSSLLLLIGCFVLLVIHYKCELIWQNGKTSNTPCQWASYIVLHCD